MSKEDFINKKNDIGIRVEDFGAYLGILSKNQYSIGVFCDNGEWVVYGVDERNNVFESFRGDEGQGDREVFHGEGQRKGHGQAEAGQPMEAPP